LMKEMNSGCKERVKKAMKKWIEFGIASPDQYDLFYQRRKEVSGAKWFNIIPKLQYDKLIRYITQNNCWNLFTSHINWDIIAGSICIYDENRIIYLYGFANRAYNNIWWHHYLKFKTFGYARKNGKTYVDMMWWAPTWFPEHSLVWVSKFKESLWGTKIEQYWSYDLVLKPTIYKLSKFYFSITHK
jgi:lipid II:glycine glycyltransferase (peptidoglycan interpeptide bridge formation enzyme)